MNDFVVAIDTPPVFVGVQVIFSEPTGGASICVDRAYTTLTTEFWLTWLPPSRDISKRHAI